MLQHNYCNIIYTYLLYIISQSETGPHIFIISGVNLGMAFNMAALEGRGGCLCDEEHFESQSFFSRDGVLRGEFELPTAGDVEWLVFSYTRSQ